MFSKKQLSLALALTASTTASYAQQSEIEEVIVTATKRAASTQDIPLAVSAVSEESLEQLGITNFLIIWCNYLVLLLVVAALAKILSIFVALPQPHPT